MDFGLLCENDKGEYVVLNDVRMAYIRLASLVYLLVYVSMYCLPIAHLRQNKPFPLLYLGHAQIKRVMHVQSCCFALSSYCLFDLLVAAASLYSYYLRYSVMSQKQNILGAN